MIVLDTNVFSELMKPVVDLTVANWIKNQLLDDLFFNTVSLAEIYTGIENLPIGNRKKSMVRRAESVVCSFENQILTFDERAAPIFGEIMIRRKSIGQPIEKFDCMIASIAVANNLDLATRNVKDFAEISGLRVINPWA